MAENTVNLRDREQKQALAAKMSIAPESPVYTMEDLVDILRLLRAPGGCPWDREQTHESIRSNLLEETHEALEAMDNHDAAALCEELGDVLLQVVFHARIAEDEGTFAFADVVDGICRKLVVRHPHVFGEVTADSSDEVLQNWDAIKRRTKKESSTGLLRAVPRTLPALMRAGKVQSRARRAGAALPEGVTALDQAEAALVTWRQAEAAGRPCEEAAGDLLFAAVAAAGKTVDAEQALTRACDRYIRCFEEQDYPQD